MSSMWVCCAVIWRHHPPNRATPLRGRFAVYVFVAKRLKAPQSTPSKHSAGVKESKAWQKGLDEEFSGL